MANCELELQAGIAAATGDRICSWDNGRFFGGSRQVRQGRVAFLCPWKLIPRRLLHVALLGRREDTAVLTVSECMVLRAVETPLCMLRWVLHKCGSNTCEARAFCARPSRTRRLVLEHITAACFSVLEPLCTSRAVYISILIVTRGRCALVLVCGKIVSMDQT